jgi:predicted amidohydrolase
MLVTSAYTVSASWEAGKDAPPEPSQIQLALVVLRPGEEPVLRAQIHDAWGMPGSGEPPLYLDLPNARVGLLTGVDLLFPEIATQLAKCGVDIVAVSSVVASDLPPLAEPRPSGWSAADLTRTWRVRTDQCFHLVGSDAGGTGAIVKDGGCFNLEVIEADQTVPVQMLSLDSSTERKKNLNFYYDFDLQALLGEPSSEAHLDAPPRPAGAEAGAVAPAR